MLHGLINGCIFVYECSQGSNDTTRLFVFPDIAADGHTGSTRIERITHILQDRA